MPKKVPTPTLKIGQNLVPLHPLTADQINELGRNHPVACAHLFGLGLELAINPAAATNVGFLQSVFAHRETLVDAIRMATNSPVTEATEIASLADTEIWLAIASLLSTTLVSFGHAPPAGSLADANFTGKLAN